MLVDGRLQRVYRNLWPSLRQFWLSAVSQYPEDTYIVYEHNRWTYRQVHDRAIILSRIFFRKYDIQKGKYVLHWCPWFVWKCWYLCIGDRVAICSRNSPEYIVAFWACRTLSFLALRKAHRHLNNRSYRSRVCSCQCVRLLASMRISGILSLSFRWLPLSHLSHCLEHTECKLAVLDAERADLLQPVAGQLLQTSIIKSFIVLDLPQPRKWTNLMPSLDQILEDYRDDQPFLPKILIDPEDNATIVFTSGRSKPCRAFFSPYWLSLGTTGLPKGVLSTQRQFLTNVLNVCFALLHVKPLRAPPRS